MSTEIADRYWRLAAEFTSTGSNQRALATAAEELMLDEVDATLES